MFLMCTSSDKGSDKSAHHMHAIVLAMYTMALISCQDDIIVTESRSVREGWSALTWKATCIHCSCHATQGSQKRVQACCPRPGRLWAP